MKKNLLIWLSVILGLSLAMESVPFVSAQESDVEEFTLEEITVTAEKRTVNVQESALSVTAVAGVDIRDQAKNTLNDVLRDIAAVQVGQGNRGGYVYIRGIGAYVDTSLADPAVAVMEDNVYNGNSLSVFGAMYDVDRVEILRGPQGTLYGRNATGGTVNVVTKNPIHEFEVLGNLQIGDYNLKHFDGAINIPLSDKTAARVALVREQRDGYLTSGDLDANDLAIRTKLLYEPNDNFSVLGTVDYYWERTMGSNTVPIPGSAGNLRGGGPGDFTVPDENGDGIGDDFLDENGDETPDLDGDGIPDGNGIVDIVDTGWILPAGADAWTNDQWHPGGLLYVTRTTYSMQVDWDMGWSTLTVLPSFSDSYNHNVDSHLAGISHSSSPNAVDALGDGQVNSRKQYTGELRLSSPAESDFIWILGYYYMKTENRREEPGDIAEDAANSRDGYTVQTLMSPGETTAFFGQATYPLTDRFRVTGGIRHSTDAMSKDYRYYFIGPPILDSGLIHYEQDVTSTTYKAGIEFDIGEDSMLYAQIATGFKQGGLNTSAPPTEFKPEELVAYEFGSKNRFLDDRLQLNVEAYYYIYENMQAQAFAEAPIGDTGYYSGLMAILNAEKTTPRGIDIEMDYLLTKNDRLTASLAYMDAKYGKFILPPNQDAGQTPDTINDMTGKPIANSPEWSYTLAYEHTWELDNGDNVKGRMDTKISDGYSTTAEQYLPGWWQEGYHKTNLNVTYNTAGGMWSAAMWVNNLENEAQTTYVCPLYRRMVTYPRTFGVNISFRY